MTTRTRTRAIQRYSAVDAAKLIPEAGISNPRDFTAALMAWQKEKVNVLTPLQAVGELPEDYKIVATAVALDPDTEGPDVYRSKLFHGEGECSITKNGLNRLAAATGISWDGVNSGRTDDGKTEHVCSWRAIGTYLSPFGERQALVGNITLDLRKGSPYTRAWSDKQIIAAQSKLIERAEAMAMNRAIRNLGLPAKMTVEQAAKPFIAVRTIVQPKDPETRAQMLLNAQHGLAPARAPAQVIDVTPAGGLDEEPDLPPREPEPEPEPEDYEDEPPF